MSRYDRGGFPEYVPVAERRARARRQVERMRRAGQEASPVVVEGRQLTRTFWGRAWGENLEAYSDFASRLPRGRSYLRHGAVLDLRLDLGRVRALVSGSEIYRVEIRIDLLKAARWKSIRERCAGQVDSLVELLGGEISQEVMEVVCDPRSGLFPAPREIALSCTCPDWAVMCKHVAATLYGVGARLDEAPELLFTLRGVDAAELVEAALETSLTRKKPARSRRLAEGDLAEIFGVEIETALPVVGSRDPPSKKRASKKRAETKVGKKARKRARKRVKVAARKGDAWDFRIEGRRQVQLLKGREVVLSWIWNPASGKITRDRE